MREIIKYPQIDSKKLDAVKELIEDIADSSGHNSSHALNELNRITGKQYSITHFLEYWGWTDLNTLAEEALIPEPPRICDLSQDEMKEIVRIIKNAMTALDDTKAEYYRELLHRSLPLSDVQSYIRLDEEEGSIVKNMLYASSHSVIAL